MDIEQILNLKIGRDLDALVAEIVMGYKIPNKHNAKFYSTDMESVWEVIEKMQHDWSWEISCYNASHEADVRIGKGTYTSRSVPEAICKAALLAVIRL